MAESFLASLPQIVIALVVLFLTWITNRLLNEMWNKIAAKFDVRSTLKELFRKVILIVVWLMGILIAAIHQQSDIQWIKVKHEGNAAFAAFAQGELSQNIGVCASTVGPGALHLINGLYNAKKERSPVLAITGQTPVEYIGTDYHQEADLKKIFDDVCEYQRKIPPGPLSFTRG